MRKRIVVAASAAMLALSSLGVGVALLPECDMEDGSTISGFEPVCVWRGGANRVGARYVLVHGVEVARW